MHILLFITEPQENQLPVLIQSPIGKKVAIQICTEMNPLPHICSLVLCPALTGVVGGEVEVTGFTPGSAATYTCDDGRELAEGSVRICQDNGEWSGQDESYNCTKGIPPQEATKAKVLGRIQQFLYYFSVWL